MHTTIVGLAMTTMAAVMTLGVAWGQGRTPPPAPCTGAEYRQFDFWIGEWTVDAGGKRAGTNRIEPIAGGCGLQESWTSAAGGTGRSLNAYSAQDGRWHQTWIGADGLWLQLTGGLREKSMVLEGRTSDAGGKVVLQRITWTPQADGRVRQLWEQSNDDGKTWSVAFDGRYSRVR